MLKLARRQRAGARAQPQMTWLGSRLFISCASSLGILQPVWPRNMTEQLGGGKQLATRTAVHCDAWEGCFNWRHCSAAIIQVVHNLWPATGMHGQNAGHDLATPCSPCS